MVKLMEAHGKTKIKAPDGFPAEKTDLGVWLFQGLIQLERTMKLMDQVTDHTRDALGLPPVPPRKIELSTENWFKKYIDELQEELAQHPEEKRGEILKEKLLSAIEE